ncbi:MAG: hypothetical protein WCJ30_06850 [Deltaproteobacteria bacterium]
MNALLALLALGAPACALDFDKFLDGDFADVDAASDGGFVDGTAVSPCRLVVGMAYDSGVATYTGSLARFELRSDGTHRRCADVNHNVPGRMRGLVAFSATRFGIAASDNSWLLDISSNATPTPIQNYSGVESVDAFALNVNGTAVLGVTYHSTGEPAGTIQQVRFFDALHGYNHGIGLWSITGMPAGTTATGVSSHPGSSPVSAMKLLVVLGDAGRDVYEAEPLASGGFRSFYGGAPGVSMVSVRSLANRGAAMVGTSASGTTGVYFTSNGSSTAAVDGPYTCPDYCDRYRYAMRDPTSESIVIAVCERANLLHLVRWTVPATGCTELMQHNVAAAEHIAGITIVP